MNTLKRSIHNPEVQLVLGISLLAFVIRIVFSFVLFPYLSDPLGLGVDPDSFGRLAQHWVEGKGFVFQEGALPTTGRGPGYPLLLASLYLVFGNLFPASVLIHCLLGAFVCVVIYYSGKLVFGSWVGYTAAVIVALHPLLIWYSPRLRYENLLTLLLAIAIFWSLKLQDTRSLKDAFLIGLFFGCAALVNQIVILLPLVLFAGFLLTRALTATLARQFVIVLLTMVTIIAPWTIRNYRVSGRIIPVHGGGIVQFIKGNYEFEHYYEAPLQSVKLDLMGVAYVAHLVGHNAQGFDILMTDLDQTLLPRAISSLQNEPGKALTKIVVQAPRFWYLSESPLKSRVLAIIEAPLLLLAAVGAFGILRTSRRGLPILLTVLYFNLVYAVLHVEGRFSAPVVPFVAILAAAGLRTIVAVVRNWRLHQVANRMQYEGDLRSDI
jgi:4-amino-4-deoxy-L-arabinose transferase-like glycosyltransferase